MGLREIGGVAGLVDAAEAVASEARRPWRRGGDGHWRGKNFGERSILSCAEAWSGVLFIMFGGEYPNRHFFSRGVMTQGGESMKQTKNSKALRDTFLVIRKGIRIHPSRKALLFQKMKKIQKPLKPKKGSKVLCIAEHPVWEKKARINPKIGWVYLVVGIVTVEGKIVLQLLGQGDQPDGMVWAYPPDYFQVVGKGKVTRPKF
jgi:hypothetical protein